MTTEGLPTVCLLTVAGLYCLVRGLLALPANLGASLRPLGIVVAACVLFLLWASFSKGSGQAQRHIRAMTYRAVGWMSAAKVKKHEEGGHGRAATKLGVRWKIVDHGCRGYEHVYTSSDAHLTPVQQAAVCYAGRAAAGSGGHEQDDNYAQWWIDHYPPAERAARKREAWALAKKLVR